MTDHNNGDGRPLRVGIIGCGRHGANLARAVSQTSSLELVSCADPDESAARRAGATSTHGVSVHRSVNDLLDGSAVDAVLIATPHDTLARSSLAAIRAGKHVMVEKPMAIDDAEARDVEAAAAEAGVSCMVGYSFRFSSGRYVHQLIADGHIGDVQSVTAFIGLPAMDGGWTSMAERGGGPLLYVGCHMIDFIFWFTGQDPPHSVFADVRRCADTGTDELSGLQIRLADGALAQVMVTQNAPAFSYEMHVYGSTGDIGLRSRNLFQPELEVFSSTTPEFRDPALIRPVLHGDAIIHMLVPELEEFARSIIEQRPPAITPADSRRVLKVLDAAIESGRRSQPGPISRVESVSGQVPTPPSNSLRAAANRQAVI